MADLRFSDAEPTASERRAVTAALETATDNGMSALHHPAPAPAPGEPAAASSAVANDSANGSVSPLAAMPAGTAAVIVAHPRVVRGGTRRRKQLRHLLLPALHALQREAGWISPGGLNFVGRQLGVPPAEAYGVATFYDMFGTEPPSHADSVCHVCVDPICALAGADELAEQLHSQGRQTHLGPCLGQCERAPAMFIQGRGEPDRVPADDDESNSFVASVTAEAPDAPCLLRRMVPGVAGRPPSAESFTMDAYQQRGGGEALAAALRMGPDEVISAVSAAGLSGRGGAAFPTGIKWRAVADGSGPKHVVANIDESEPGTFKDRLLCERDPLAVIESIAVAGLVVGAEHGWIYIRGEYPLATQRLRGAITIAREHGWLGDDAAGSGQRFDIELRRGAGAYICGEETALFNSLEGFRGEPRNKPPFPTTHGLFGRPTVVNNPETLLNVSEILRIGPDGYRSAGTQGSPGTKLFCLSGHIGRPGLYEAPFGMRLGDLVDLAGGVQGTLRAVLLGGAAGSFVGPDALELPLSLEDTRAAGTTLGSGPVMVFNDTADMSAVVQRLAQFFRDESCGQCVPCRVGTVRQHEIVTRIRETGAVSGREIELISDIAAAMGDASICGLGHTAASAVVSALRLGLLEDATT
ncbi:NADH-ubiquinone oxidoreductase-F iron-sulfur binding region domain-containing protein [Candidatus Poriferisodalis sp.]|uniref:NADH-ubiquinone oxidoreductase-F iron-sulfur binding region domain-containing protein n=1 Tax=Candidatus Poriferisodalis sp. TaxID=3101277 RepID=UPI003B01C9CB